LAVIVMGIMQFIQRNTIDRILKNSGQDKYTEM
jgi:histone H3/H4